MLSAIEPWKWALYNLVPQYLSDYFTRNYNVHSYNTHRETDLHLPKVKLSLAKRTFRYLGSALFDVLPRSMQKAESLSSFKILIYLIPIIFKSYRP